MTVVLTLLLFCYCVSIREPNSARHETRLTPPTRAHAPPIYVSLPSKGAWPNSVRASAVLEYCDAKRAASLLFCFEIVNAVFCFCFAVEGNILVLHWLLTFKFTLVLSKIEENFARFNDDVFVVVVVVEWLFPNPATISLGNLLEIVFQWW